MRTPKLPRGSGLYTEREIRKQFLEKVIKPFQEEYKNFNEFIILERKNEGVNNIVAEGKLYELGGNGYYDYTYATFQFRADGNGSYWKTFDNINNKKSFDGSWGKVMKAILKFIAGELAQAKFTMDQLEVVSKPINK